MLLLLIGNKAQAQSDDLNAITTAVPFLLIAPDSRSGAMGDIGVATSPDGSSQHWNAAKYPFIEDKVGFTVSYSPWLRQLTSDIGLSYVTGYYKIDNKSAISASLRYFSLGEIEYTDKFGTSLGNYEPNEFAVDMAYSRKLGDHLAGAVTLRYINSNLTQGQDVAGQETSAGQAVAADVAIYYNNDVKFGKTKGNFAFGVQMSNVGNRISYSDDFDRDFLPMNFRFGPCLMLELDEFNSLTFAFDINKLLVPTPPTYNDDKTIADGMDPDRGVGNAIFTSWNDAPGGFSEEMKEFYIGGGIEYAYDEKFFVRGGYFYENELKGNRKYFTLGAGFKYNVFTLDFSYLIPTTQRNPLENTLRFTLLFNFQDAKL